MRCPSIDLPLIELYTMPVDDFGWCCDSRWLACALGYDHQLIYAQEAPTDVIFRKFICYPKKRCIWIKAFTTMFNRVMNSLLNSTKCNQYCKLSESAFIDNALVVRQALGKFLKTAPPIKNAYNELTDESIEIYQRSRDDRYVPLTYDDISLVAQMIINGIEHRIYRVNHTKFLMWHEHTDFLTLFLETMFIRYLNDGVKIFDFCELHAHVSQALGSPSHANDKVIYSVGKMLVKNFPIFLNTFEKEVMQCGLLTIPELRTVPTM